MKESTRKLIQWCGLGLAILCLILAILFAMNNGSDVKTLADVQSGGLFDAVYWILFAMIVISIVAIVLFLVRKLAQRFKTVPGYAKKFFIVLGVVIVVCLVAFLLARGDDVTPALMEKSGTTEGVSKLIGAACIMIYILVIGAAVSIVYSEIAKSLKK
jgi:magnesium-transporting ATPase (P-type)